MIFMKPKIWVLALSALAFTACFMDTGSNSDEEPPVLRSLVLFIAGDSLSWDSEKGWLVTYSRRVKIHFDAIDNKGVSGYRVSEDPIHEGNADSEWTPIEPTEHFYGYFDFDLSENPGNKRVYQVVKDLSGNHSAEFACEIELRARPGTP